MSKTFEEVILEDGGIPHNKNIVKTYGRWVKKLDDKELFDISTAVVASFTLTSEMGSAVMLASQCLAIEKEIHRRFKDDVRMIELYLKGSMNFAENISKVAKLLIQNNVILKTNKIMDMRDATKEDCGKCEKTDCPGHPEGDYDVEKDPNIC